ncbi:glycosyltransferase family 4 protein [Pseudoalteromonas sp. Cn5-37]|uniref:glycosyltransferase family 4 protein n=1 Tax=Pseudoalteromonas sp. Cn5-37 TaxID=2908886 RepID=UPI001F454EA9|nr:glycosyltransferase family 4 protein [Pseudoalteromonas sp. Cn5-37]MCF2914832.1 glycosyltransferase family 4 protein [Pseudoalteromonas sp. Cn5-37]
MKYSVILFVDSSIIGGIESHIIALCNLLEQYNIKSSVLFYQDHNNIAFYNRLDNANIDYQFAGGSFFDFYRIIKGLPSSSLLHTHGYKASILGKLACLMQSRRCISTYHAGEQGQGLVYLYNRLDKLLSYFSFNFAVSDILSKQIYKAELLENFISLNNKSKHSINIEREPINVGFVGRLSYEKAPDIFIETAKQFSSEYLNFHMFGDGPMASELDLTAITYHGQCEPEQIWPHLDVLVVCSRAEGLPMVVLEAMSNGILVISAPVGQLVKTIEHLKNGLLMTDSSTDALVNQLNYLRSLSAEQKRNMLKNAKQLVEQRFSGKQQFEQLNKVYTASLPAFPPNS